MKRKKILLLSDLKAVIFDLDDTLYDCYEQLVKPARRFAMKQMIEAGLDVPFSTLLSKSNELFRQKHTEKELYIKIVDNFGIKNEQKRKSIIHAGYHSYYNYFMLKKPEIIPFPDVEFSLDKLRKRYKLFMLTVGIHKSQEMKIKALGLEKYFDRIYYKSVDYGADKKNLLKQILKDSHLRADETMMVGNRRDSDIAPANNIGCFTSLIQHGEYAHLQAVNDDEIPDFEFKRISQLCEILVPEKGNINKIFVLAAGKGTNMMPLTKNIPKVLVKVNDRPFLWYLLTNIQKAGYKEIFLIVGYKQAKIKEFLKEYGFKDVKLIEQKRLLGTGHAVSLLHNYIERENFVVIAGDNLYSPGDLKVLRKNDNYCHVVGRVDENPGKYGVMFQDKDYLVRIKEKPRKLIGNLVNTSLYKFTPEIFKVLKGIHKSERGEYELIDAITKLGGKKMVKISKIQDYWLDMGTVEDIPEVEAFLKKKHLFRNKHKWNS